jgi:hypothetical protein
VIVSDRKKARSGEGAELAAALRPAVRASLFGLLADPEIRASLVRLLDVGRSSPYVTPAQSPLGAKRTRELCAAGELRARRVHGRWVIDRAELDRYLDEHAEKADAPGDGREDDPLGAALAGKGAKIRG